MTFVYPGTGLYPGNQTLGGGFIGASASNLIDETLNLTLGSSGDTDQVTTLKAGIGPTDTSFQVTDVRSGAMGLSAGIVEIDSELMYVSTVATDGTATVVPWGRGIRGTAATSHNTGAKVVSSPTYPRAVVLTAINEALGRVFPQLWVPKIYATTTQTIGHIRYDVDDQAEWLLEARWLPPTGFPVWRTISRARLTTSAGQSPDEGVVFEVADYLIPGQPIEFTYAQSPGMFSAESDDFETVTGLPLSCRDLIVLGAATGNLVASQELGRLQISSIEQQNRAALVAPSAALTSSRYLEMKYEQRLKEEAMALRRRYPIRIGRSWA